MLFTGNCYQKDVELVDRFHEMQEAELEVFSRMCCDLYIACDEQTSFGYNLIDFLFISLDRNNKPMWSTCI
jgi:hypothetical protein